MNARGLQQIAHDWANGALPKRTVLGGWAKLMEELGEVIKTPYSADEWGDIFIILFDLACIHNIDVQGAVLKKLKTNNARTWTRSDVMKYHDMYVRANPVLDTLLLDANEKTPKDEPRV